MDKYTPKQRNLSDRRSIDRRNQNQPFKFERRVNQRRSGTDRRLLVIS